MFTKNVYETACKETWSLATPLIAADYSGHLRISSTGKSIPSWNFSEISNDISAPWVHESTSLDINARNGIRSCMLYGSFGLLCFSCIDWVNNHTQSHITATMIFHSRKNNSRCLKHVFAFSVKIRHIIRQPFFTWMSFQTCRWRGYLPGCFNAPNFPLTLLQFSTRFPNSLAYIHLAASLLIWNSVETNKFGSKCDAFGADMSSRMSAPGISCSKETVLRIEFMMDHHRDYWARCNMCWPQNEAGWFAYASWIEVLLHVFAGYRSLQGRGSRLQKARNIPSSEL